VHARSSESVVKVSRNAAELSSGATRYSLRLFRGSQCYAVPQSLMLKKSNLAQYFHKHYQVSWSSYCRTVIKWKGPL